MTSPSRRLCLLIATFACLAGSLPAGAQRDGQPLPLHATVLDVGAGVIVVHPDDWPEPVEIHVRADPELSEHLGTFSPGQRVEVVIHREEEHWFLDAVHPLDGEPRPGNEPGTFEPLVPVENQLVAVPVGPVDAPTGASMVVPQTVPLSQLQLALRWQRTGGPVGGLGYDVRMRPGQPHRMYVSDAWAGTFLSTDAGATWNPSNEGITVRRGNTNDAIPVFCLTVDDREPDIVWTGTKDDRGIFKSTDAGASWSQMDQNLPFNGTKGITFRGFTVHPESSDVVYAAAEISSFAWETSGLDSIGKMFDRTMGVVYRTEDGGEHWDVAWEGKNLARYVLIDPSDHEVMYISTGIFDREGATSTKTTHGGTGVFKSTDGGLSWGPVNEGLDNLYVGSLAMHPRRPATLLAATGNNAWLGDAGVYITHDGGGHWEQVLAGDGTTEALTAVEFAGTRVAYAGSQRAIYRSEDGGTTWVKVTPQNGYWGPPGILAGWPIDFQTDPENPDRVFANAYGGGNFLSENGGKTWIDASKGYTGAQIRDLAVDPNDGDQVWAAGRSGGFVSRDAGASWAGRVQDKALSLDWPFVTLDRGDPDHVYVSSLWAPGKVFESGDGGTTWAVLTVLPKTVVPGKPNTSIAVRTLAIAPSRPATLYAGTGGVATFGQLDNLLPAHGIYASHDGGASWQRPNNPSTDPSKDAHVHEIVVHPDEQQVAFAATVNRGLLKTNNGGQSWEPRNPSYVTNPWALAVAMHPDDPRRLFLGLEKNGVHVSDDMGLSWTPMLAGLDPNASISSIVIDPADPAMMYAADLWSGVYRFTPDDGRWVQINHGLDNREINALAISADGQTVYGGSEGSGVFVLELPEP